MISPAIFSGLWHLTEPNFKKMVLFPDQVYRQPGGFNSEKYARQGHIPFMGKFFFFRWAGFLLNFFCLA